MASEKCLDCGQMVPEVDAVCSRCGKKMSDQRSGQDRRDGEERRDEDTKAVDPERREGKRRQDDQDRRKFSY